MTMTRPKPYQKRGVLKIEGFDGRALLADEMGLGKTLQALLYLHRNQGDTLPAIVVCPASLKWNWEQEAMVHLNWRSLILSGRRTTGYVPLLRRAQLIILNYEILKAWIPKLLHLDIQTVIFDEAHYVKSPKIQRTKALRRLCEVAPHVLALSGTPLTNRPIELWSTLNILYPRIFPSYHRFGHKYCNAKLTPWGWQFEGAKNLDQLHKTLTNVCMIRRRKADVLKDLPPASRHIVTLPIERRSEYELAKKDFIKWLKEYNPKKATRAIKAERLVRFGYLKRLAAQLKLPSILEWIANFLEESDRKLLVYGIHRSIVRELYQHHKHQAVVIDGKVSLRHRKLAVQEFQHSKKVRLLFGNIVAAGVGLNLTAASDLAFVELAWTPGEHSQVEARPHRIGQTQKVNCFYLVAKDTIEVSLCERLQVKQANISQVLDGGAQDEDLNIYDLLEKELKNGRRDHLFETNS